ncbi:MAG TPA: universal stress protein [Vicinamibacterales bacterium]|nr:universal stress protein [Vicinamibacterales bacterium]
MATFRRILVDIDAAAPRHPALTQAFDMAARAGARVTIMDVLPHVPKAARLFATPEIENELVRHRQDCLARAAREAPAGVATETALLRGRPASAILDQAARIGADLVVRAHGRDLKTPPPLYGPVDMQLLRKCPVPVWIVGPDSAGPPRRILAAVDAATEHEEERSLNASILDAALTIRSLWGGTLTVMNAWCPFGDELLRARMKPEDFEAFLAASRGEAEEALDALVAGLGPESEGIATEIVKAEPHEAILAFVEAKNIDLVVMGTVGRGGVAGLVMGNTAERVLHGLRRSVLAIKPGNV